MFFSAADVAKLRARAISYSPHIQYSTHCIFAVSLFNVNKIAQSVCLPLFFLSKKPCVWKITVASHVSFWTTRRGRMHGGGNKHFRFWNNFFTSRRRSCCLSIIKYILYRKILGVKDEVLYFVAFWQTRGEGTSITFTAEVAKVEKQAGNKTRWRLLFDKQIILNLFPMSSFFLLSHYYVQ